MNIREYKVGAIVYIKTLRGSILIGEIEVNQDELIVLSVGTILFKDTITSSWKKPSIIPRRISYSSIASIDYLLEHGFLWNTYYSHTWI